MRIGRALALLVGVVLLAAPTLSAEAENTVDDHRGSEEGNPAGETLNRIYKMCGDSLGCSLWELANVVNGISARESLNLFSGLFRVEKKLQTTDEAEKEEEVTEVKEEDAKEISIELGADTLASSVERFLRSHVVRLVAEHGATEGRANEEDLTYDLENLLPEVEGEAVGRRVGRGKLRRLLIPLLIGFKLKAGVLFPLFFSAVAIIALKALGAGLTALLLASVLGLKAIVESSKPHSKISVEVVKPHPITIDHQYHHGHHHGHAIDSHWGWGRDGDDQAYKGYYYGDSRK